MRIAILGAGVIGVTSAWYLRQAGHDVVVVDRQEGPALETSFANAGEISPGYASPWAAPGIPVKAMRWLLMDHAPLIIRPKFDPDMLRWLASMLWNCTHDAYAINKTRMVRIAEYSRDQLIELRRATGISYDERSLGTLQLFREQKQLDQVGKDIAVLQADGVPFEVLDRTGCFRAEPGLAASTANIVGGLRLPNDETGDCYKFTQRLTGLATEAGVEFKFGTEITHLELESGRINSVVCSADNRIRADTYLIAMGSYSTQLLGSIGIRAPIYPVKGYSLTVPVASEDVAPVSTLLDESYKIAITRLGDRIRVGGMAEISGFTRDLPLKRQKTLAHSLQTLFPGAGDLAAATYWSGLRPMTPDSTPIVGPTKIPNLYVNSGHGTLGWTMACGSARVIADIISGKRPAIDASDLGLNRY